MNSKHHFLCFSLLMLSTTDACKLRASRLEECNEELCKRYSELEMDEDLLEGVGCHRLRQNSDIQYMRANAIASFKVNSVFRGPTRPKKSLSGTSSKILDFKGCKKKKGTHGETYINATGGSSRIIINFFWACSPGGLEMQRWNVQKTPFLAYFC